MSSTTRRSTKAVRAAGFAQAVRLASATSSRRAALAIVNAGRPAKTHASYGSLARALKPDAPGGPRRLRTKLSAAHELLIVDATTEFRNKGFIITKAHLIEAVADIVKDLQAEEQANGKMGGRVSTGCACSAVGTACASGRITCSSQCAPAP